MNYSITITNASFDLTLQTTNAQTIRAAIELADRACGVKDDGPAELQPLPKEIKVEGGPLTFAKGTLADVVSRYAKDTDAVITIEPEPAPVAAAPDPDVHVEPPPPVKAAKATPAKKTAKPAAAPPPAKEDPVEPVLIPSPPENLKALQDETASLTMEAIGRNRPAVIALMGEFGATKFSDIKTDPAKLKGFRARIESITDKTMLDDNGKLV